MVQFESEDVQEWREALDAYQRRLEGLGNVNLVALDEFYRVELPKVVAKRHPEAYVTQDELMKIMEWKLSRGKWRARLQNFVAALSDDEVQAASQKAFAALPNVKEAVSQLSVLKGIGPATASTVLATHAPIIAPFMSDEAMVAALGSVKDYTLKSYLVFAEKLRNKAECILLIQDHAVEVVKYCTVFQVCQRYCKMRNMEKEIEHRAVTYSEWKSAGQHTMDQRGWHPITFDAAKTTFKAIKDMQDINEIQFVAA